MGRDQGTTGELICRVWLYLFLLLFSQASLAAAPFGGYTADNVIPTAQVTQSGNGDAIITINFRAKDAETDGVTLNTFQYTVDGGSSWNAPTNGDATSSLSTNWSNNGSNYTSTTDWTGTVHSFTFNADHADITGISGEDQNDIQIRFTINDGALDSDAPATSQNFQVDDIAPITTITSSTYNATTNTMVITGTNFSTIASASTDIKTYVDWSKFVWDINGDNATTTDVTFVLGNITSLTVSNDTTLTLVLDGDKATALEGKADYSITGGTDTFDVSAGFSKDVFGNLATTDAVADAVLTVLEPNISVTKISSVISDPISATNHKRIPGAIIQYTVTVSNSGSASPDANTIIVANNVNTSAEEFDFTTGVIFTDGDTTSNLTKGTVVYSNDSGTNYTYSPSTGYDPNITNVKIPTTGSFAFGGAPAASFTIKYYIRIKYE